MYVFMYVRMYVCMYQSIYVICIYVCVDPTLTKPEASNKSPIVTTRLSKEVFVRNIVSFHSKLTPRGPHPCQATKLKQNSGVCNKI